MRSSERFGALTSLQQMIDSISPDADLDHMYIQIGPNKPYRTVRLHELPAPVLQGIADRLGDERTGKTDRPDMFFIGRPRSVRTVQDAGEYAVVFQSPEAALSFGIDPTTGRAISRDKGVSE